MSYRLYSELFADAGVPFSPSVEVAAADQIVPMAAYDLGIGFVPELFPEATQNTFIFLPWKNLFREEKMNAQTERRSPLSIAARVTGTPQL